MQTAPAPYMEQDCKKRDSEFTRAFEVKMSANPYGKLLICRWRIPTVDCNYIETGNERKGLW